MSDGVVGEKPRMERSPSYPFISLKKAEERARQFWEKHRKEGARLAAVAPTWAYGVKSSGLQQTVGALKQYGLLEDIGSGEDRKVQLSDLGRRLVADERDGAREAARREAAMKPRLFQEYRRWIGEMPSEAHCLSELELDRGFNRPAAYAFLKAFRETVSFAGLADADSVSSTLDAGQDDDAVMDEQPHAEKPRSTPLNNMGLAMAAALDPRLIGSWSSAETPPLSERLTLSVTVGAIAVNATLLTSAEVDTVIRFLEANKLLLDLGAKN